jgi:uncharacterized protein YjbI with pentapeptide repeats
MGIDPSRPDRRPPLRARARLIGGAVTFLAIGAGSFVVLRSTPPAESQPGDSSAQSASKSASANSAGLPPIGHLEPWAGEITVGPGMNASGKNLRGTRIAEADLTGANFDGSDLYGARFRHCNLRKATFRGTLLTEAMLDGCDVAGADFSDAVIEDMLHGDTPVYFSPEQFKSTRSYVTRRLLNCLIRGSASIAYDFARADLTGSQFAGDLDRAEFAGAVIRNCVFRGPIRFDQIFATKSFRDRKLEGLRLLGEVRGKLDFSAFRLQDCEIVVGDEASFEGAEFIGRCRLDGRFDRRHLATTVNYKRGNLANLHFARIDLSGFDLSGVNLTGAVFDTRCDLNNANFDDSVITRAVFRDDRGTLGLTLAQIKSTWNFKHGRMAGVTLPASLAEALARESPAKVAPDPK